MFCMASLLPSIVDWPALSLIWKQNYSVTSDLIEVDLAGFERKFWQLTIKWTNMDSLLRKSCELNLILLTKRGNWLFSCTWKLFLLTVYDDFGLKFFVWWLHLLHLILKDCWRLALLLFLLKEISSRVVLLLHMCWMRRGFVAWNINFKILLYSH